MTNADPHPGSNPVPGEIKINHSVLAGIVRLAALEVPNVCGTSSGIVEQIGGLFSKRESDRGVRILELPEGGYEIEIRIVVAYGCELGDTAQNVQLAIRNQIQNMTGKQVRKVDVIIDGVKAAERKKDRIQPDEWNNNPLDSH